MAKRGRKPRGEFTGKLSHFSTRIQVETREALEKEAKATGKSISQLAERLLVAGLAERQEEEKDKQQRALCFLISEIARQVVGPNATDGKREVALYDWRSDPFFYRAFTLAVGRVLGAISPPGEIKPPKIRTAEDEDADPIVQRYIESFRSPEARAEYAADRILQLFRDMPRVSAEEREKQRKLLSEFYTPSLAREFYGMPDAAHDLAVKPRSGEMVEMKLPFMPFSWGQK
jgi:hypothetical protein